MRESGAWRPGLLALERPEEVLDRSSALRFVSPLLASSSSLRVWKKSATSRLGRRLLGRIEEEGEKYAEHKIWAPAWIRFEKKGADAQREGRDRGPQQGVEDTEHAEEVEAGGTASEFHGGGLSGKAYGTRIWWRK